MTTETKNITVGAENLRPQLTIADDDLVRLDRCVAAALRTRHAPSARNLEAQIARAYIVPCKEVPRDVVTMRSCVRIEDVGAGTQRQVTLVYPEDADATLGKVSVLAPIGAAIIGLRAGDETEWSLPDGDARRIRVVQVIFQPQAAREANR